MKSIFIDKDLNEFMERINKISPNSKPEWGTMNAAQMMAHCAELLKMVHSDTESKRGLISFLIGKLAKKKFLKPTEVFTKNSPTDPRIKFPDTVQFEAEKKRLIEEMRIVNEMGSAKLEGKVHSFFGKMDSQEWDVILSKHLDHHLRQFGV